LETRAETTYVVVPNDDKQGLELLEAYFLRGKLWPRGLYITICPISWLIGFRRKLLP
jgi:hypothetical protein